MKSPCIDSRLTLIPQLIIPNLHRIRLYKYLDTVGIRVILDSCDGHIGNQTVATFCDSVNWSPVLGGDSWWSSGVIWMVTFEGSSHWEATLVCLSGEMNPYVVLGVQFWWSTKAWNIWFQRKANGLVIPIGACKDEQTAAIWPIVCWHGVKYGLKYEQ